MIENVKETLGYKPTVMLADAGYFSYDNVKFLLDEEIDAYTGVSKMLKNKGSWLR